MKLKALIIEDEANSREILQNYLQKYCPEVDLHGEAANIEVGLELIQKTEPDLVFLDVEMPYGNAFDLLEKVGQSRSLLFNETYQYRGIDKGRSLC